MPTDQDAAVPDIAAMWFARMRGPDAASWQSQFDAWVAAEPRHRAAYNRLVEHFSNSELLKTSARFGTDAPVRRKRRYLVPAVAFASVAAALIIWIGGQARKPNEAASTVKYASDLMQPSGQARSYRLVDGSVVTLDAGARLRIAFSNRGRDLWLDAGRARFRVAHDERRFIVHAGGGTVTARGTIFDVALDADRQVQVALIEGHIDVVATEPSRPQMAIPAMRTLNPGEAVSFSTDATRSSTIVSIALPPLNWPLGNEDFRSARLADLVAAANRYSARPIKLSDPSLASLTVSGRFRLSDPERFADSMARLFDLNVRKHDGEIVLSPKNISTPP